MRINDLKITVAAQCSAKSGTLYTVDFAFKYCKKELPVPVIKDGKYGLAAADGTDRLILTCDYDYIGLRKGYYILQKSIDRGFYTKGKLFFPLYFDRLYISSSRDVMGYHKNSKSGNFTEKEEDGWLRW